MSQEIREFYWVRTLSIVLLFFVHSTLGMTQYSEIKYVQYFMLSSFFYVSGYLSFMSQKKGMKRFARIRFTNLYLPFLVFLVLYRFVFPNPWFNSASNVAYLYHATLLSVFQQNMTGIYDLHHLWFVPVLLVFMLFFAALERFVSRLRIQFLAVSLLFIGNCILWQFNPSVMLSAAFTLYLFNYAAGFWTAKTGKLDAIHKWWILPIVLVSYLLLFLTPEWINLAQGWEWLSLMECWLRQSILALSATVASINLFARIRSPYPVKVIANSTLMIYLLEPQVRLNVGQIFSVDFFLTPLQNMQLPMFLRIIATLSAGVFVQILFETFTKASKRLQARAKHI